MLNEPIRLVIFYLIKKIYIKYFYKSDAQMSAQIETKRLYSQIVYNYELLEKAIFITYMLTLNLNLTQKTLIVLKTKSSNT